MVETILILKGVVALCGIFALLGGVVFWIWYFFRKYDVFYFIKYKILKRPYDNEMREVVSQYENADKLVYDTLREGGDHNVARELKFIHNQLHSNKKRKLNKIGGKNEYQ